MASISKRSNGTFSIRVSAGMKNGKQLLINETYHPLPGSSEKTARKGAEQFAALFENLVKSGGYKVGMKKTDMMRPRHGKTVREFIEERYFDSIKTHLSPNTCRTYEAIIMQFILPSFGDIPIADMNDTHVQAFVDFLSSPDARADKQEGEKLSPATVRRYATVLSSVMTEAWKQKFIPKKPLSDSYIIYPKIVTPELEVYSEAEVNLFLENLKDEEYRTQALLSLAVTSGMRRGELAALKWSDIDMDNCLISVKRSAYKAKGEKQKVKLPKSISSVRRVPLTTIAKEKLLLWKSEQDTQRDINWVEDYVFTDGLGDMISIYLPTEICSEYEKKHGLRHLKLHGLRHTCGTLLIANGVDIQTVKSIFGHSDWETTQRYVHTLENNIRSAGQVFDTVTCGRGAVVD